MKKTEAQLSFQCQNDSRADGCLPKADVALPTASDQPPGLPGALFTKFTISQIVVEIIPLSRLLHC